MSRFRTALEWALVLSLLFGILSAWAGDWAAHALQAALLLAGAGAALEQSRRSQRVPGMAVLPLGVAVAGMVQIACGRSEYAFATANAVCDWTAAAAAVFLGFRVLGSRRERERAATVLITFASFLSAVAILQWYSGAGKVFWLAPTGYTDGVVGSFLNRDQYAAFIELALPVALYRAFAPHRTPPLYAAVAGTMVASVIATGSRAGSFVVSSEVAAFCAIALMHRGRSAARTVGAVVATSVVIAMIGGWEFLWLRLQEENQAGLRRYMYESSITMVRDRPLTGFGLGCWPEVYPQYALFDDGTFVHHAHNDWLEWMVDGGAAAAALMVSFGALATRMALRHSWGLGVTAVLIHALLDFPMHKPAIAALVFVMAGVLAAASLEDVQRRTLPRGTP